MAQVTLSKLVKNYDETPAVRGIDLDISDKEFVVLVGPSGCGKSTTLRMIAGLEDITGGEVLIGGAVVNDVPPKDRDIAMVFQSYALYPHMSVYENMSFGLRLKKIAKDEITRRVQNAAQILDISELLDRKPKQLSGGQRQRVAMGRAIVRDPKVFLFDEPLSNLDAKLRVQMRTEIKKVHQKVRTTTVYVTHDQVEAMTMGQRIAVMSEARLQQVGTPQELYDHPRNRFVAGFTGSPSMNFIDVTLNGTGDGAVLEAPSVRVPLPARFRDSVGPTTGRKLILGVRPEHIELAAENAPGGTFHSKADVVEYLGNEELIHATTGDLDLVAVIGSDNKGRPGHPLTLTCHPDNPPLFDPDTPESLRPRAAAATACGDRPGRTSRKRRVCCKDEHAPAHVARVRHRHSRRKKVAAHAPTHVDAACGRAQVTRDGSAGAHRAAEQEVVTRDRCRRDDGAAQCREVACDRRREHDRSACDIRIPGRRGGRGERLSSRKRRARHQLRSSVCTHRQETRGEKCKRKVAHRYQVVGGTVDCAEV